MSDEQWYSYQHHSPYYISPESLRKIIFSMLLESLPCWFWSKCWRLHNVGNVTLYEPLNIRCYNSMDLRANGIFNVLYFRKFDFLTSVSHWINLTGTRKLTLVQCCKAFWVISSQMKCRNFYHFISAKLNVFFSQNLECETPAGGRRL